MDGTSPSPLIKVDDDQSQHILSVFLDLCDIVQDVNYFEKYQISIPKDHTYVQLTCENIVKIFVGPNIFLQEQKFSQLINNFQLKNMCIFCFGSLEEINRIEEKYKVKIHVIIAPLSVLSLVLFVESIHKCQTDLVKVKEEKESVDKESKDVKYVLSISRELNGERDIQKLLSLILTKAREVTKADAGSIYTLEKDDTHQDYHEKLRFRLAQNDSIEQNLSEFDLPISETSIVGSSVLRKMTINIEDLYDLDSNEEIKKFGFNHDSSWDKRIGYESHSMLTTPIFDISYSVIGVIQLINCKKDSLKKLNLKSNALQDIVPFDQQKIEYAEIVAQQAGIALENAKMNEDIQKLFDSFVNASVATIELRDPTTSGHSHRVAHLTLNLAKKIDSINDGIYKGVSFNEDQFREIKYASLLHDFGKVGVKEEVLVKAKKLYPKEFKLVEERFKLIKSSIEIEYLNKCLEMTTYPERFPLGVNVETFKIERDRKFSEVDKCFEFICKANKPTILEQGGFEFLNEIGKMTFTCLNEKERPYLLSNEIKALSVSRGSLTAEEFSEIQSHVTHTYEFLRKIPWGPKLMNVPQIAAKHHEKLDGSGYPHSAFATEIPIQSRMMTIADIFDALTASDRPYKKAVPVERALEILEMEVKGGKVDKELFDVFVTAKIFKISN